MMQPICLPYASRTSSIHGSNGRPRVNAEHGYVVDFFFFWLLTPGTGMAA